MSNMSQMFGGTNKLLTIYVGKNWITQNADTTDMFKYCGTSTTTLKTLKFKQCNRYKQYIF